MRRNVLSYLEEAVQKTPEKVAYGDEAQTLTFRQVWEQSRSVGTFLWQQGCLRHPVAVWMGRGSKTIAAFLGVVSAGGVYVPIDADMPPKRVKAILESCKARWIICDEENIEQAKAQVSAECISLYDEISQMPVNKAALEDVRRMAIDVDPIYIVFTSGSTGTPKGVAASHRSVIDYIEALSEVLGFDEDTVFGSQTPLHVDACLKEIFPTLKYGATTWLIPRQLFLSPVRLVEFLNEHKVNTICWVASALSMVSSLGTFDVVKPRYLRRIAFGSEVFPQKQLRLWQEAAPEASFTNLYGPTEGTGMCCYYHVARTLGEEEPIPIGSPFPNCEILLLDEEDRLTRKGEICIRGTAVTLGYYNNPEKTAESFVQNPLNQAYPEIIYRTGDLGAYNESGELVFLSRKDNQIKHLGHRIELGEIEAAASNVAGVGMCGCIYPKEEKCLALFYVGSAEEQEVSRELAGKLPRYMLPREIRKLPKMPMTSNGKLDRKGILDIWRQERSGRKG